MTSPNDKRRLNELWEDRHTHDDDPDVQTQIKIIQQTIGQQTDTPGASGSGAHVHAIESASQSIAVGGELVEWSGAHGWNPPFEFAPTYPTTTFEIPKAGYYNVAVQIEWASWAGGGSVEIRRTRDGETISVWPTEHGYWTDEGAAVFQGEAPALRLQPGDTVGVWVDHGDASAQTLASATCAVYLVHGVDDDFGSPILVDAVLSWIHDDPDTEAEIEMTSGQRAGDMLLMLLISNVDAFSAYPAGWTALIDNQFYTEGVSFGYFSLLYKISDGTESDTSATLPGTNQSLTAHAVWVVRSPIGFAGVTPDVSSIVRVSGSNSINPPAVTPAGAPGNYVVFACVVRNGGGKDLDTISTGYTPLLEMVGSVGGTSSRPGIEVLRRLVTVTTSEDPSLVDYMTTWTGMSVASVTVAVKLS